MKCNICGKKTRETHKARILNRYQIQYYRCLECEFTQTEQPYWLNEAYSDAISASDTGVMARNIYFSKITKALLFLLRKRSGKFLDFGGGYGIFTRLMRDQGFDFYWYDKYAKNLLAREFEGSVDDNSQYDAITSFENFEHFENPIGEIEKILALSDTVIFSTELMPENNPAPENWWYYCLEHGQHISLFSLKTLEYIANEKGVNLISDGKGLHIFTKDAVSPNLLRYAKIILKTGLGKFLNNPSKTNSDMQAIIDKMKKS